MASCEYGNIGMQPFLIFPSTTKYSTSPPRRHNEVTLSSLPRLDGKVGLVTDANDGILKVTTHALARQGGKVQVIC